MSTQVLPNPCSRPNRVFDSVPGGALLDSIVTRMRQFPVLPGCAIARFSRISSSISGFMVYTPQGFPVNGYQESNLIMSIRFKFRSSVNFDTLEIDGHKPYISVGELRTEIMCQKKLNNVSHKDFDLVFSDALTGQEYNDDRFEIPSGSSVIVKRVPIEPAIKGRKQIGRVYMSLGFCSLLDKACLALFSPAEEYSSSIY
ncbi:hypothetical protein L6452_27153 [Arctium lappa]|uniref:Uncharacterized protein n=1 Tax=Arctium lappa TaxID=4217 RepID=A0ACB8ZWV2_ARCLA|nr:hypothetical protein L6452_27153 [Arctium lappa]